MTKAASGRRRSALSGRGSGSRREPVHGEAQTRKHEGNGRDTEG